MDKDKVNKFSGGGSRIRTYVDIRRQIYSLLPLTARLSLRPFLLRMTSQKKRGSLPKR